MWIDAHCHLTSQADAPFSLREYNKAKDLGVERFFVCCLSLATFKKALMLKRFGLPLDIAVGIHPLIKSDLTLSLLTELLNYQEVVAIGECGLDFRDKNCVKEEQIDLFKAQIALANKYHKPLVVHSVKASKITYDCLASKQLRVLFHAYSGSYDLVKANQKEEFYYSFGFHLTQETAKKRRQVASLIPLDKILIETDASFSKKTSIKNLPLLPNVARSLALLREIPLKDLAYNLSKNYLHLLEGR